MKIESSTVEAHRFGSVRRKGYDPVEVDRVMERLVATLRSYEEDTDVLETRVREADDSVEAIRRTFAAAQRTREEMIAEGNDKSVQIVQDARRLADELSEKTRTEIERMQFDRDKVILAAHQEWVDRVSDAEDTSFDLLLKAEVARSSAVSEKAKILDISKRAADARVEQATEEASRLAEEMVTRAANEEQVLAAHLHHLRSAVAEVDTRIHDLASLATPYTDEIAEIIDLTTVDDPTLRIGSGRG